MTESLSPTYRALLRFELDEAIRQRAQIDAAIAYFTRRLGSDESAHASDLRNFAADHAKVCPGYPPSSREAA